MKRNERIMNNIHTRLVYVCVYVCICVCYKEKLSVCLTLTPKIYNERNNIDTRLFYVRVCVCVCFFFS